MNTDYSNAILKLQKQINDINQVIKEEVEKTQPDYGKIASLNETLTKLNAGLAASTIEQNQPLLKAAAKAAAASKLEEEAARVEAVRVEAAAKLEEKIARQPEENAATAAKNLLENAAAKKKYSAKIIQKRYRGNTTRKNIKAEKDADNQAKLEKQRQFRQQQSTLVTNRLKEEEKLRLKEEKIKEKLRLENEKMAIELPKELSKILKEDVIIKEIDNNSFIILHLFH